jgi:hypothetical protein
MNDHYATCRFAHRIAICVVSLLVSSAACSGQGPARSQRADPIENAGPLGSATGGAQVSYVRTIVHMTAGGKHEISSEPLMKSAAAAGDLEPASCDPTVGGACGNHGAVVDPACPGADMWMWDYSNRQGNELCVYGIPSQTFPGSPVSVLHLADVPRTFPCPFFGTCLYDGGWENAVRSFWAGNREGYFIDNNGVVSGFLPFELENDSGDSATDLAIAQCGVMPPFPEFGLTAGTSHASLSSCDGRFELVMQTDGNLVLYQSGVGALWASNTWGSPATSAVLSPAGQLVVTIYPWNTPVGGPGQYFASSGAVGDGWPWLSVQDDGNVVVYVSRSPGFFYLDADFFPLWATNTCCR